MDRFLFLHEVRALEKKLQQKAGVGFQNVAFPELVMKLSESGSIDSQEINDLKELLAISNEFYSSRKPEFRVPDEAVSLLARITSNPKLQ